MFSVKTWGNAKDEPILAIHGFLDNAASFDQLIPLITPGYFFVCVDLPGHGLSSHYPDGTEITYLGYVFDLKRVFNYFAWSKCIILCHSLGSHFSLYFASIFTESVSKLIILDLFIGQLIPERRFISDRCIDYIENLLSLEMFPKKPQIYTSYAEALTKFFESRYYYLAEEPTNLLLQRSLVRTNEGYIFTNDKRLQFLKYPLITKDFHFGLIRMIKCPICITLSSGFEQFFNIPNTYNTLEVLKASLRNNLTFNKIEGNHYVHLNHPQAVAEVVNKFLLRTFSRL